MSNEFSEDDPLPDLELELWSVLAGLEYQRGFNAAKVLFLQWLDQHKRPPKRRKGRPRDPEIPKLLQRAYVLQHEAHQKGEKLTITAAALQADDGHHGNRWQSIVREHKRVQERAREWQRRMALDDSIFFGLAKDADQK